MMISGKLKSRHLSPIAAAEPPPPSLPPSPNHNHNASPNRHLKPKSSFRNTGLLRGVWPSSTPHSSKSFNPPITTTATATATATAAATTLADYLGDDRKRDSLGSSFLRKQRSCSEFNRFENNSKKENKLKENHKPGGSMRYTGKFRFGGRSSASSSSSSSEGTTDELVIMPGRLSVNENEIRRRSYSWRRSESFSDDSECSDMGSPFITDRNSPASYMASTISSRKSVSCSPTKSTIKNPMMKKANSSKWGAWSGQPESPPMTTNSPCLSSKPPTSPSKTAKRNILHMGLDLIKIRKNGSGCLSPLGVGLAMVESVHQLRMMHGSWMQWRYANARANVINQTLDNKAKDASFHAWKRVTKLQQSVLQKRLQIEREKLEIKLNSIFHSQMKMLEAWKDMEKTHTLNVSTTKDCLETIACRVPLIQGAKMDPQAITIALRHGTDLVGSVMSMASSLKPTTGETALIFSELAKVAIEEKSLLEECFEHFRLISKLEVEERSLRCSIMK